MKIFVLSLFLLSIHSFGQCSVYDVMNAVNQHCNVVLDTEYQTYRERFLKIRKELLNEIDKQDEIIKLLRKKEKKQEDTQKELIRRLERITGKKYNLDNF